MHTSSHTDPPKAAPLHSRACEDASDTRHSATESCALDRSTFGVKYDLGGYDAETTARTINRSQEARMDGRNVADVRDADRDGRQMERRDTGSNSQGTDAGSGCGGATTDATGPHQVAPCPPSSPPPLTPGDLGPCVTGAGFGAPPLTVAWWDAFGGVRP